MVAVLNLYVDDSGSRRPDRKEDNNNPARNWFGLGGLIVAEAAEEEERKRYDAFIGKWPQIAGNPLHSVHIRNRSKTFSWLSKDQEVERKFGDDLTELICKSSFICTATVINRTGYRARYEHKYSPQERWLLCKTAFTILLERSVKYAVSVNHKLRVLVERGDETTDKRMARYYDELKVNGMPFERGGKPLYDPLDQATFSSTLYEFRTKNKSSPLMQLADLCLYPMCRYPYDKTYRPYQALVDHGRLIDCILKPEEIPSRGIKYSCFDPAAASTPPGA